MKILTFGCPSPDYMQDDLYHGLKTLFGTDVECNVNLSYLYDDYPHDIKQLYGRGISYAKNLDHRKRTVVSGPDIVEKLTSKYYDAVIYLSHRRCLDMYNVVNSFLPFDKIAMVDGEDDTRLCLSSCVHFKRELIMRPTSHLFPISFAIPAEKILDEYPIKKSVMSAQIPGSDRNYKFETEAEYYAEYRQSAFAITMKKAGWDCKRHYEILANRCVPVFKDIEQCPRWTMTTLPKFLLKQISKKYEKIPLSTYLSWEDELYDWTKNVMTTTFLANDVMDKLSL